MKRRQFLSATAALSAFVLASHKALGQEGLTRGAIVIGVDMVDGLPKLTATDSAKAVATWLGSENFEVKLLADDAGKVTLQGVFDAVADFVNRGNMDMLVIYFAGHGFMSGDNEWWMLSGAPVNPNEAISLLESAVLAKDCGIPNVIFISDACRSSPDSLNAGRVRGGFIFPNNGPSTSIADIDKFMATRAGGSAFELPVADSVRQGYQGIFTACFLEAFQRPEPDMVHTLQGVGVVVPNRALKNYLKREVSRRVQQQSITLRQLPDVEVTSNDDVYIGKAHVVTQQTSFDIKVVPLNSVVDLALENIGAKFNNDALSSSNLSANVSKTDVSNYSVTTGFDATKDLILSSIAPLSFESQTGFSVMGAVAAEAFALGGSKATITRGGDGTQSALVRIDLAPGSPGETVVIRFADGSGTVAAAIKGFVGNIVASDAGVSNVSYVPSSNSSRWSEYAGEGKRLNELHAVVASAASLGAFRIEGDRATRAIKGRKMGDDIRVLKSVDPTLGVYAAYAYWDADLIEDVRSVSQFMSGDLGLGLFDVEMLAWKGRSLVGKVIPFCPMLTQGWEFLRVLGLSSPQLDNLKRHLKPSLWTTFDAAGMNQLVASAQIVP
ncbi:caspase family protein [Rhizobium leguminosarum]|uniref:caspase family protein n=1 Tax=Rhizobium leguminosarum TaxID=384 RepID=UPI001C98500B|nr:caspase family protein [Rhizobium leguminosarum]MBY5666203.1 caspase family protein [Rhizobium leguminosarum]MBY5679501.1 caspase family protein [Rhizobium leguminosarum]